MGSFPERENDPNSVLKSLLSAFTHPYTKCSCRVMKKISNSFHRRGISSVGRALDCREGGRGFDCRGRTNTQGLKITEK